MVIIGSITGNRNTLAGNIPPQADLGNLEGFKAGFKYPNVMINGGEWEAPKAYKDAKVCNMLTTLELHRRFHDKTGVTFATLYPGCIAETGLFRNHVKAFQVRGDRLVESTRCTRAAVGRARGACMRGVTAGHVQVLFPKFQKNITQGYVSEDEAGRRLASVVGDKTYAKSGVYWSWDNNSEPFVNTLSEEAQVWIHPPCPPLLCAPVGTGACHRSWAI